MKIILRAFFAVVLMLCAAGASLAADLQKQFSLSASYGNKESGQFDVAAHDDNIVIEAEWTGQATDLALILNGPGKTNAYARKDGKSVLRVEYKVTQADIAKGKTWVATIANFSNKGPANGTMRIWRNLTDKFLAHCTDKNQNIGVRVRMDDGLASLYLMGGRVTNLTAKYAAAPVGQTNVIELVAVNGTPPMLLDKNQKTLSYKRDMQREICKVDITYEN